MIKWIVNAYIGKAVIPVKHEIVAADYSTAVSKIKDMHKGKVVTKCVLKNKVIE